MIIKKQCFDKLEFHDGYVWAVNKHGSIPLEVSCVSSEVVLGLVEIVIQQQNSGAWWYSQEKFSFEDAEQYINEIMKSLWELDKVKWKR